MSTNRSDQSERFKELARALGCDESGAAFARALARIVPPRRAPPGQLATDRPAGEEPETGR